MVAENAFCVNFTVSNGESFLSIAVERIRYDVVSFHTTSTVQSTRQDSPQKSGLRHILFDKSCQRIAIRFSSLLSFLGGENSN